VKQISNKNPSIKQDQALFTWEAPEYFPHERGKLWHILAIITTTALIFGSLFLKAYLTATAFFLLALVYYLIHSKPNKQVKITITNTGLWINQSLYAYATIREFWLKPEGPHPTLNFIARKKIPLEITLLLPAQTNVSTLREYLLTKIPEVTDHEDTLIDKLIHILKL